MSSALRQAQESIRRGEPAAAIAVLQPVVERHPRAMHPRLHLARAQAAQGNFEEANRLFSEARSLAARPYVVDLLWGEALLQQNQLAPAEALLQRALGADHKNVIAGNLLALCAFRQGRHGEAMSHWERFGWFHGADYLIEVTIAFEQFLLSVPPATIKLPEQTAGQEHLSSGLRLMRRWKARRLVNRAEHLLTRQNAAEAYQLTNHALYLWPEDSDALLLRAVALYEMERYEQAGRVLLDLAQEESFVLPRYFLAYSLLRLGQIEVAEAMMAKLSPQGPFDYYLNYHLGLARLLRGDMAGARQAFAVAYRNYFVDSREYCFEHLIHKVRLAVERLDRPTNSPSAE